LFFMPVMMLVMFYSMPSALVLYWSTNTVIMIAQQLIQKHRVALKKMPKFLQSGSASGGKNAK